MKTYKTIDWIAQCVFIFLGLCLSFANTGMVMGDSMSLGYAIVGCTQLSSAFVHLFFPANIKIKGRKVYHAALIGLAVLGLIAMASWGFAIYYLFGLLFISPVLAIFYVTVCFLETDKMKKQAIAA